MRGLARFAGAAIGVLSGCVLLFVVSGIGLSITRDSDDDLMSPVDLAAQLDGLTTWSPDLPGTWEVSTTSGRGNDICLDVTVVTWRNEDAATVTLAHAECPTRYHAYSTTAGYKGDIRDDGIPAGSHNYDRLYDFGDATQLVWRERNVVMALVVDCAAIPGECEAGAVTVAKDLSQRGDGVRHVDSDPPPPMTLLTSPLALWVLAAAPTRLWTLLRSQRWRSEDQPPRFTDLTPVLTSRRWRRLGRLICAVATVTTSVFAALTVLGNALDPTVAGSVVSVALVPISGGFGLGWWLLRSPEKSGAPVLTRRTGIRAFLGLALCSWAGWTAAFAVMVTVLTLLLGEVARAAGSDPMFHALNNAGNSPGRGASLRFLLISTAAGNMRETAPTLLFATFPTLIVAYGLRNLGQLLLLLDAAEMRRADPRAPILYLRSFDEDRLKIPAARLRVGWVERLVPWRRRSFERVLVEALSDYGPVYAVNDPRRRMPRLGAARESLPHDRWYDTVDATARLSLVVVMSATPEQIRDGLKQELDMLNGFPAARLMLVLAPYRHSTLTRRWAAFKRETSQLSLFHALDEEWVQEGTHVLTHSAAGWRAWGARRRSAETYALAVGAAMRAEAPAWHSAFTEDWTAWRQAHRGEPPRA